MDYKETEKLITKVISNEVGTHLNMWGKLVHEYFGFNDESLDHMFWILTDSGFEVMESCSHCIEFWSVKYLSSVSFCEGDVYIVQFETIDEFEQSKEQTIQFYKE